MEENLVFLKAVQYMEKTINTRMYLSFINETNLDFSSEIIQTHNENRTSSLFIQPDGTVYKRYFVYNDITNKNIDNLLKLSKNKRLQRIPEITMPTSIITTDGRVRGYFMPYHKGVSLNDVLFSDAYSDEFRLQILIKLASVILRLPKDVFIGDLHGENVLVLPDGEIRLIDIDGFSTPECQISCPFFQEPVRTDLFSTKKYKHNDGSWRISKQTDILCFYAFVLSWIMGVTNAFVYTKQELFRYFDYLEKAGFDKTMLNLIIRIFTPRKNRIDITALKRINLRQLEMYQYSAFVQI